MKTQHWIWVWIAYNAVCGVAAGYCIAHNDWAALALLTPGFIFGISGIVSTIADINRYGKD